MNIDAYDKILVIKLDHIGDVLLSTPVMRAIKDKFPQCRLDVMVSSRSAPVLQNNPFVDTVYCYDSDMFDRNNDNNLKTYYNNFRTICTLRNEEYDLVVGLREDSNNMIIQSMIAGKYNISFRTHTLYPFVLDECVDYDGSKHMVDIHFDLLYLMGISKATTLKLDFFPSRTDKIWAEKFLLMHGLTENDILITMMPCGGWFLNWWPHENFSRLCNLLLNYNDRIKILLIGGKGKEQEVAETIIANVSSDKIFSAAGKTTLHQLGSLFEKSSFAITNDSGTMHLATGMGLPVIALFGPSPHRRFGPVGQHHTVITKEFTCSPCQQFVKGESSQCANNRCMQNISVDEVMDVAKQKINAIIERVV